MNARVAVSMRIVQAAGYSELRDAISHDWIRLLDRFGLTPVLVPNVLSDPVAFLERLEARALVVTNGDDLDSASPRDRTEHRLLDAAVTRRLPIFGVCRGLQLLNAHFNGASIDLPKDASGRSAHAGTRHRVVIASELRSALAAEEAEVNSFHNQAVRLEGLARDLKPFALSDDGIVEGLYHPRLPMLAVQWHPERVGPSAALDERLIRRWLEGTTL